MRWKNSSCVSAGPPSVSTCEMSLLNGDARRLHIHISPFNPTQSKPYAFVMLCPWMLKDVFHVLVQNIMKHRVHICLRMRVSFAAHPIYFTLDGCTTGDATTCRVHVSAMWTCDMFNMKKLWINMQGAVQKGAGAESSMYSVVGCDRKDSLTHGGSLSLKGNLLSEIRLCGS